MWYPIRQSSLADNSFTRERSAITLVRRLYIKTDLVFIYEGNGINLWRPGPSLSLSMTRTGKSGLLLASALLGSSSGAAFASGMMSPHCRTDRISLLLWEEGGREGGSEGEREGGRERESQTGMHTNTHFCGPPGTGTLTEGPLGLHCYTFL